MEESRRFPEWIAYYLNLMTGTGRTQADIARRMHVHPSLLTKWKAGDYGDKPRFDNVTAFADVARLTPQQRVDLLRAARYEVSISTVLDAPEYVAARERYLAALRKRYGIVETHAFTALSQDEGIGSPRRLPLLGPDGVYVPLRFDSPTVRQDVRRRELSEHPGVAIESGWESEPETLPEVLKLLPGHLAIIGDAGSGKTTALHVIVSALASDDPEAAFGARFSVLDGARPLPIFLPLRLFEQACNLKNGASGNGDVYTHCPDDLVRFVDDWFAKWETAVELPAGFLADHIRAGRAWFLLDALDEVANTAHRLTVHHIIEDLARQLNGTRLIVTARVAAYRDICLDDRFAVVTVRNLDDEQRADMVRAIYRGLALPDHARRADDLVARFAESKELQSLGRTPVMVWTAAVIHALRGELPDSRAALYDAYVDILLKQSFKRTRYDVTTVDDLVEGEGWPLADRLHYLTYAAFQVHTMLERQLARHGERQIVIGEDELADDVLAPYFRTNLGYILREARDRALEFITLMVERSGLLYEKNQGYTFGDHLTMQEFLAAYYLAENYALEDPSGYAAFFQNQARRAWWREVVLLAAGYLGQKPGFQGSKFLVCLAQGDDPASELTALALAGRSLLQLRVRRKRPRWYAARSQDFANRLYALLYTGSMEAPVPVRQEAALILGRLHGLPGEAGSLRDPRFVGPLGLPDFVDIPAGTFWMGGDKSARDNEHPRHRVTLDGYAIAQYPTTNAMYAQFIAVDGYANADFWKEAIADGYWKEGKVKDRYSVGWFDRPRYWEDARRNNPSQPVVGVNWYEAVAYCRWLTIKRNDGYTYRLPTEAEWERAARWGNVSPPEEERLEEQIYPWGDAWHEGYCNSKETNLKVTSPVGLFPLGAAAGKIHDMVGNVYEWCGDWYGGDYYAQSEGVHNPQGPRSGSSRILRGGAYYADGRSRCRCGCRFWGLPYYRYDYGGFRCVRISPHNP